RLFQLKRVQRKLVQPGGFLVREKRKGAVARMLGVLERLVDVAAGRGLEEVVGKLSQMRLGILRVEPSERFRDAPVELDSSRSCQPSVERLADERVREP